jgi:hypothetical protein
VNNIPQQRAFQRLLSFNSASSSSSFARIATASQTSEEAFDFGTVQQQQQPEEQYLTSATTSFDMLTSAATSVAPLTSATTNFDPLTSPATSVAPLTSATTNFDPLTSAATSVAPLTDAATNVDPLTSATTNVDQLTSATTSVDPLTSATTSFDLLTAILPGMAASVYKTGPEQGLKLLLSATPSLSSQVPAALHLAYNLNYVEAYFTATVSAIITPLPFFMTASGARSMTKLLWWVMQLIMMLTAVSALNIRLRVLVIGTSHKPCP